MIPRPFSRLPVWSMTAVTSAAEMTVIGPVGPLAWVSVPPNSAAKMPTKMAP